MIPRTGPALPLESGRRGWGYHGESGYLGRASFRSRTDAGGQHSLRIDFLTGDHAESGPDTTGEERVQPFPAHIDATATVMDVNRQAWSTGAGFLLHPADRYIGLRTARYFVEQGRTVVGRSGRNRH